jgi:hypothetical protein
VRGEKSTCHCGSRRPSVSIIDIDRYPSLNFVAIIVGGENLDNFIATGPSKQASKEAAAKLMVQSGHCVCTLFISCNLDTLIYCDLSVSPAGSSVSAMLSTTAGRGR